MTQELYSLIVGSILLLIAYLLFKKAEKLNSDLLIFLSALITFIGGALVIGSLTTYFVYIRLQLPSIMKPR